ncbi:MAG: hypothetical protein HXX10_07015 [Rhodoplanes sp.]|uniref:hypothetical protein n=1 Tax=Rhodoplanes sp. TaxID=1968906 RepID=UPI00185C1166|nr:hypothetical protein [Rhodoplanes sp.]NVO13770.1 hypothetical protein [Rhodoplanes sp.]
MQLFICCSRVQVKDQKLGNSSFVGCDAFRLFIRTTGTPIRDEDRHFKDRSERSARVMEGNARHGVAASGGHKIRMNLSDGCHD